MLIHRTRLHATDKPVFSKQNKRQNEKVIFPFFHSRARCLNYGFFKDPSYKLWQIQYQVSVMVLKAQAFVKKKDFPWKCTRAGCSSNKIPACVVFPALWYVLLFEFELTHNAVICCLQHLLIYLKAYHITEQINSENRWRCLNDNT